jgi:hypothetical protein
MWKRGQAGLVSLDCADFAPFSVKIEPKNRGDVREIQAAVADVSTTPRRCRLRQIWAL